MTKIKKVAIIGTGVIGAGWIIRCLAHNKIVYAFDRDLKLKKTLIAEIKRTWPYVKKLFNKKTINLKNFKYFTSIEETLRDADFIQECASENYALKTKLMNILLANMQNLMQLFHQVLQDYYQARIYSKCKNPERTLIGHPFNPVYLLPAVEIVPGKKTAKKYLDKANKFYKSISMNPIMVKHELPGYLSDRLQEALWREGLHIINEGHATTEDLDRAIEDGPGLRWSLMGTFLTFHLAGGKAGNETHARTVWTSFKTSLDKIKSTKIIK